MSTVTKTNSTLYYGPIDVPYTGTKDQPDLVSFFFKNDQNQVALKYENIHATLNYSPINFRCAIERIKKSANMIVLCLKGQENDLWNATKNLTRGLVALVPIIGNIALYVFDKIKINLYVHPKIENSLSSEKGPLLGVSFDGKIIKTLSAEEYPKLFSGDGPLEIVNYTWIKWLEEIYKSPVASSMTREELINKWIETLQGLEANLKEVT